MIAEPTFIASLNGLCGFILVVQIVAIEFGHGVQAATAHPLVLA